MEETYSCLLVVVSRQAHLVPTRRSRASIEAATSRYQDLAAVMVVVMLAVDHAAGGSCWLMMRRCMCVALRGSSPIRVMLQPPESTWLDLGPLQILHVSALVLVVRFLLFLRFVRACLACLS
jgi:hypothetical protein